MKAALDRCFLKLGISKKIKSESNEMISRN